VSAAVKALRRQALAHARKQSPAQHQDHEDAVNQALLESVESGDYSATTVNRRVRTLLRAARPDNRRAMRCVLPDSALQRDGSDEDDSSEAPGEALDRVAAVDPLWRSAADKPERLPPTTRAVVSHLRAELQNELVLFWHPEHRTPPWRSWARRIALVTGRAVDPVRVAAAMNAGHLSAKGRQRRDFGQVVKLDGQLAPPRELATRQVGALFRLCGVSLADTREQDARLATAIGRSIRALRLSWTARPFEDDVAAVRH
jgi:hypothetical protein